MTTKKKAPGKPGACQHDLSKEYMGGYDTGDMKCVKCGETFTPAELKKRKRDVNQNAHRIFAEMIERSEQPPNRGKMKIAPPPAKKNGATK